MLHRTLGVTSIACALLLSAASAFADGYSEGKALYKSGNFPAALAKFQQATAERPKAAKVFWNLGLTQLKLRDGAGAVGSFEQAQRLDGALSFTTDPTKFQKRLGQARALIGGVPAPQPMPMPAPAMRAPAPMPMPAPAPFAPPPGAAPAARLFPEPFLDQVARDVMQNRRFVRDYAALITPPDLQRLEQLVGEAGAKGFDLRIVSIPATWATRTQSFLNQLAAFIKASERDVLVITTPRGANAYASKIRAPDMQRILVSNKAQFLTSYGQGVYAIAADIGKVLGLKQARVEGKKKIWIYVLIGVGGLILLIIIISVVRANQRKAEEAAEYKRAYDAAIAMMDPVAEKLGDLQLSIQIVDDEDARMLIRRGETNYFGAQGLIGKIPAPGKGGADPAGVRRLAGQLQEATVALEKAEEIVSRLTNGKPIDKAKILEHGGKKLGCYFCSKPMRDESAGRVVGVELKGQKMDVLSCNSCADEYSGGNMPKVRMVEYEGRPMHWSMVPAYDPWYDYYHQDRYRATWVDAVVLATIFDWGMWHSHPSPYVSWYPPGAYSYGYGYTPSYYNFDNYAHSRGDPDVNSVIGSSWDQGGAPSGIEFAGSDMGGGGGDYGGGAAYAGGDAGGGGGDVGGGRDAS